MTTVGYGDLFSQNLFGRASMILATFVGAICTSLYVMGVNKFLQMDYFEKYAFTTIQRDLMKNEMKQAIVNWIQCQFKLGHLQR
mmetsp:Transcript_35412/g.54189  ORF Transcript_35412/g.54189 Transcript_35412/m.54189 type:complete len:84 (+) Transcript_35412:167-418(+)